MRLGCVSRQLRGHERESADVYLEWTIVSSLEKRNTFVTLEYGMGKSKTRGPVSSQRKEYMYRRIHVHRFTFIWYVHKYHLEI